MKILIEHPKPDLFNANALHGHEKRRIAGGYPPLAAIVCSLLVILLGVLGANPAWHKALHEKIQEAAAGTQDTAVPAPEDHDSSHPEDSCAVCTYLHQQVGGIVGCPSTIAVLEVTVLHDFTPPSEPTVASLRREPCSRGPPVEV